MDKDYDESSPLSNMDHGSVARRGALLVIDNLGSCDRPHEAELSRGEQENVLVMSSQ